MPGIVIIHASRILFNSHNKFTQYHYMHSTDDEIEVGKWEVPAHVLAHIRQSYDSNSAVPDVSGTLSPTTALKILT